MPSLTVAPTSGPPGHVLTATGEGFRPGATGHLRWANTAFLAVTADNAGRFIVTFPVPDNATPGAKPLCALLTAKRTNEHAATAITVLPVPAPSGPVPRDVRDFGAVASPGADCHGAYLAALADAKQVGAAVLFGAGSSSETIYGVGCHPHPTSTWYRTGLVHDPAVPILGEPGVWVRFLDNAVPADSVWAKRCQVLLNLRPAGGDDGCLIDGLGLDGNAAHQPIPFNLAKWGNARNTTVRRVRGKNWRGVDTAGGNGETFGVEAWRCTGFEEWDVELWSDDGAPCGSGHVSNTSSGIRRTRVAAHDLTVGHGIAEHRSRDVVIAEHTCERNAGYGVNAEHSDVTLTGGRTAANRRGGVVVYQALDTDSGSPLTATSRGNLVVVRDVTSLDNAWGNLVVNITAGDPATQRVEIHGGRWHETDPTLVRGAYAGVGRDRTVIAL